MWPILIILLMIYSIFQSFGNMALLLFPGEGSNVTHALNRVLINCHGGMYS